MIRKRTHFKVGIKKNNQKYIDKDSIAIARLIKGSILVEWVTTKKGDGYKVKESMKQKEFRIRLRQNAKAWNMSSIQQRILSINILRENWVRYRLFTSFSRMFSFCKRRHIG